MTVNYREAYGMFASNGILFNHESPRRGETFVSRKISRAVAHILARKQTKLYLGNLQARRDWGYTPEYVEAMWRILQQPAPGDYVVGTGETHTVQEFVEEAFSYVNLDWKEYVEVDPRYFRPTEVDYLQADASKMRREMQWEPRITFKELVRIMIDADMEESGLTPMGEGVRIMGTKFGKWHRWRNAVSDVVNAAPGAAIAP
jgi:GDPmannose 4,6-dehydratase